MSRCRRSRPAVDVPAEPPALSEGIVGTLRQTLPGLARAASDRRYDAGHARLDMCLAFLDKIVVASTDRGIDPALPALVRAASARAADTLPGDTDWACVFEGLLPRG